MAICSIAFFYSGVISLSGSGYDKGSVIPSFLFFSTLWVYNLSQKRILLSGFETISKKQRGLNYALIVLFAAILSVHLLFLGYKVTLYLMHLGIISFLYNIPYLNDKKLLPLRGIPLIKVFLIAYVWASIGAILPAVVLEVGLTSTVIWLFLCKFTFIVSITLPFDIRDYYKDREHQLITIPRLIGVKNTRIFSVLWLLISIALQAIIVENYEVLLMNVVAFWLIVNASETKRNYYYLLFIDGAIILFMFMIWLDKFIL